MSRKLRRTRLYTAIVTGFVCCMYASVASAGPIALFSDRTAWENAAASAGLTVTTNDFSTAPGGFPTITLAGVTFEVGFGQVLPAYDAANERIGFIPNTSSGVLNFDITSGALFGFGLELATVGNLKATDIDGDDIAGSPSVGQTGVHFIGLLGSSLLDPDNPFPSNPFLSGPEFVTSGDGSTFFDNLSVATGPTGVPEPGTAALFGIAIAGLGFLKRKSKK